jgi:hypothetical protein
VKDQPQFSFVIVTHTTDPQKHGFMMISTTILNLFPGSA